MQRDWRKESGGAGLEKRDISVWSLMREVHPSTPNLFRRSRAIMGRMEGVSLEQYGMSIASRFVARERSKRRRALSVARVARPARVMCDHEEYLQTAWWICLLMRAHRHTCLVPQ